MIESLVSRTFHLLLALATSDRLGFKIGAEYPATLEPAYPPV